MKYLKYLIQFIFVIIFFIIFKIIGLKKGSDLGEYIGKKIGPKLRSKIIIKKNLNFCFNKIDDIKIDYISSKMWSNLGRTFAEYVFLEKFKKDRCNDLIKISGVEILNKIKTEDTPVIFISGHFANFELMAMKINDSGVKLATIYRPLNNIFLNPLMEYLRKKYICPNQIKKGRSGLRELIYKFKNKNSIALMIDQRVSEGIGVNLFKNLALTTTIPAQMVLRYNCKIIPVEIKRINNINFEIKINNPINIEENEKKIETITIKINQTLEKMILSNPEQWIWPHNRWK